MVKPTAEQLVDTFASAVAAQSAAIGRGDAREGNKRAREYEAAWAALQQLGAEGIEALSVLLRDPRPEVQAMAACHLLRHGEKEALAVLKRVARSGGPGSFGAAECLRRWREGTQDLDASGATRLSVPAVSPPEGAAGSRPASWPEHAEPPSRVPWGEIAEFERLEERLAAVDLLHPNTIGVNRGYVEWCPNNDPPSEAEVLAWRWFIRPDLAAEIAPRADAALRQAIEEYNAAIET